MDIELQTAATEAFQMWQSGNQQGAVDRVRPLADADNLPALALISWFLHQMGEPGWREGIPYAERAIDRGVPWVAGYFIGNMLNSPEFRARAPELTRKSLATGWWGVDPIGNAVNAFNQGDPVTGTAMLALADGPWPWPHGFQDQVASAQQQMTGIREAADSVATARTETEASFSSAVESVDARRHDLETRASQLETLLEQVTNGEIRGLFEAEAATNETEAKSAWDWGLRTVCAAAGVALLPLLIYYVGQILGKPWLNDQNLTTAHVALTVSLGAVAGVLLARSRNRDRARQRAKDLSVALGTMIVYSGQIPAGPERQQFMQEMARAVIESFLRQDSTASADDGKSLISSVTTRT